MKKITLGYRYETLVSSNDSVISPGRIGECVDASFDDFTGQTICHLRFDEGSYYYLASQLQDPKSETSIQKIITDYSNEYSGPCRGKYLYDLDKMNKDLNADLKKEKISNSKKRAEFIREWIQNNERNYQGDFEFVRDDMNCNYNIISFGDEDVDCQ